jgi:hypothetical protein
MPQMIFVGSSDFGEGVVENGREVELNKNYLGKARFI